MGKYSEVIGKLEKFTEEGTYQEQVNVRKGELQLEGDWSAILLATRYKELRARKDEADSVLKDINFELEAISQLLTDRYELEGTTSVKLSTGESIRTQSEPYAVIEDREAFRVWCIENGYEKEMRLMWQTTNSICKERLLEGEEDAPGVNLKSKTKIVLRKG